MLLTYIRNVYTTLLPVKIFVFRRAEWKQSLVTVTCVSVRLPQWRGSREFLMLAANSGE